MLLVPILLAIMVFVAFSEKSRIKQLAKGHSPHLYALLTSETDRAFDTISDAKRSGLVLRQRNMVELEVDTSKWRDTPLAERKRLLSALAQSAFGRAMRPGEAVSVFAGTSRTPLEVKRGGAA